MTRQTWATDVQTFTYRTYTSAELDTLERMTFARVFDNLRSPWNVVTFDGTTDADGYLDLSEQLRIPTQVAELIGTRERRIPHGTDKLASDWQAATTSARARLWVVAGGSIGTVRIQVVQAEQLAVRVRGYGQGVSATESWQLYNRYPALFAWAGAVEGFQLQGDEQGRERALAQFAVELDIANQLGDMFGHEQGRAVGAL